MSRAPQRPSYVARVGMILAAGISMHGYASFAYAAGPGGDARAVLRPKLQLYEAHQQHQAELIHVLLNFDNSFTHLKYPLNGALLRYHEEFGDRRHGVLLAEHEGKALEVHHEAPHVRVTTNGQLEATDALSLAHFGIHRIDQLQAAIRNVLLTQHDIVLLTQHDLPTDPLPSDQSIAIRVRRSVAQATSKRLALAQHADATLLDRYHKEVTLALQPTAPMLEFTDAGDERLELSGHSLHVNTGTQRAATTGDLRRLKMADQAQVEAAIGRLMVRLAGIPGAPDAADRVELAREELLRRIEDVHALTQWIHSPNDHPALKRLLQVRALGKHAESVFVTKGPEELLLKEFLDRRGVFGTYRGMRLFFRKRAQSPAAVDEEEIATVADLHRFKLSTTAEFDAMAVKLIEGIDPRAAPHLPTP